MYCVRFGAEMVGVEVLPLQKRVLSSSSEPLNGPSVASGECCVKGQHAP